MIGGIALDEQVLLAAAVRWLPIFKLIRRHLDRAWKAFSQAV